MNKSELIKQVASNTGQTNAQAKVAVESVLNAIQSAVITEGKVSLLGFGNFSTTVRKARIGRNPSTGAAIEIAEKTVVKFKPQF